MSLFFVQFVAKLFTIILWFFFFWVSINTFWNSKNVTIFNFECDLYGKKFDEIGIFGKEEGSVLQYRVYYEKYSIKNKKKIKAKGEYLRKIKNKQP